MCGGVAALGVPSHTTRMAFSAPEVLAWRPAEELISWPSCRGLLAEARSVHRRLQDALKQGESIKASLASLAVDGDSEDEELAELRLFVSDVIAKVAKAPRRAKFRRVQAAQAAYGANHASHGKHASPGLSKAPNHQEARCQPSPALPCSLHHSADPKNWPECDTELKPQSSDGEDSDHKPLHRHLKLSLRRHLQQGVHAEAVRHNSEPDLHLATSKEHTSHAAAEADAAGKAAETNFGAATRSQAEAIDLDVLARPKTSNRQPQTSLPCNASNLTRVDVLYQENPVQQQRCAPALRARDSNSEDTGCSLEASPEHIEASATQCTSAEAQVQRRQMHPGRRADAQPEPAHAVPWRHADAVRHVHDATCRTQCLERDTNSHHDVDGGGQLPQARSAACAPRKCEALRPASTDTSPGICGPPALGFARGTEQESGALELKLQSSDGEDSDHKPLHRHLKLSLRRHLQQGVHAEAVRHNSEPDLHLATSKEHTSHAAAEADAAGKAAETNFGAATRSQAEAIDLDVLARPKTSNRQPQTSLPCNASNLTRVDVLYQENPVQQQRCAPAQRRQMHPGRRADAQPEPAHVVPWRHADAVRHVHDATCRTQCLERDTNSHHDVDGGGQLPQARSATCAPRKCEALRPASTDTSPEMSERLERQWVHAEYTEVQAWQDSKAASTQPLQPLPSQAAGQKELPGSFAISQGGIGSGRLDCAVPAARAAPFQPPESRCTHIALRPAGMLRCRLDQLEAPESSLDRASVSPAQDVPLKHEHMPPEIQPGQTGSQRALEGSQIAPVCLPESCDDVRSRSSCFHVTTHPLLGAQLEQNHAHVRTVQAAENTENVRPIRLSQVVGNAGFESITPAHTVLHGAARATGASVVCAATGSTAATAACTQIVPDWTSTLAEGSQDSESTPTPANVGCQSARGSCRGVQCVQDLLDDVRSSSFRVPPTSLTGLPKPSHPSRTVPGHAFEDNCGPKSADGAPFPPQTANANDAHATLRTCTEPISPVEVADHVAQLTHQMADAAEVFSPSSLSRIPKPIQPALSIPQPEIAVSGAPLSGLGLEFACQAASPSREVLEPARVDDKNALGPAVAIAHPSGASRPRAAAPATSWVPMQRHETEPDAAGMLESEPVVTIESIEQSPPSGHLQPGRPIEDVTPISLRPWPMQAESHPGSTDASAHAEGGKSRTHDKTFSGSPPGFQNVPDCIKEIGASATLEPLEPLETFPVRLFSTAKCTEEPLGAEASAFRPRQAATDETMPPHPCVSHQIDSLREPREGCSKLRASTSQGAASSDLAVGQVDAADTTSQAQQESTSHLESGTCDNGAGSGPNPSHAQLGACATGGTPIPISLPQLDGSANLDLSGRALLLPIHPSEPRPSEINSGLLGSNAEVAQLGISDHDHEMQSTGSRQPRAQQMVVSQARLLETGVHPAQGAASSDLGSWPVGQVDAADTTSQAHQESTSHLESGTCDNGAGSGPNPSHAQLGACATGGTPIPISLPQLDGSANLDLSGRALLLPIHPSEPRPSEINSGLLGSNAEVAQLGISDHDHEMQSTGSRQPRAQQMVVSQARLLETGVHPAQGAASSDLGSWPVGQVDAADTTSQAHQESTSHLESGTCDSGAGSGPNPSRAQLGACATGGTPIPISLPQLDGSANLDLSGRALLLPIHPSEPRPSEINSGLLGSNAEVAQLGISDHDHEMQSTGSRQPRAQQMVVSQARLLETGVHPAQGAASSDLGSWPVGQVDAADTTSQAHQESTSHLESGTCDNGAGSGPNPSHAQLGACATGGTPIPISLPQLDGSANLDLSGRALLLPIHPSEPRPSEINSGLLGSNAEVAQLGISDHDHEMQSTGSRQPRAQQMVVSLARLLETGVHPAQGAASSDLGSWPVGQVDAADTTSRAHQESTSHLESGTCDNGAGSGPNPSHAQLGACATGGTPIPISMPQLDGSANLDLSGRALLLPIHPSEPRPSEINSGLPGSNAEVAQLGISDHDHEMQSTGSRQPRVQQMVVSQARLLETGGHETEKSGDSVHDVASGSVHLASPGALPQEQATDSQLTRSSHQDSGGCGPGMPGAAVAHVDVPLVPAVARRSSEEHPMLPAHARPLDLVEESSSEFTSTPQGSTAAVSPLGNSEHCMNGTRSRKPKEEQMRGLAVHPRAVSQAVPPETGRHPAAKSMDSVHDVASGSVHFASPAALPQEKATDSQLTRSSHQDSGGCGPGMPGAAVAHVDVPLVPAVARRSSEEHPMLPAHALLPLDLVEESSSEFTSTPQGSTAAVSPLGNSEHCMNGTRSRKPKEEQMRGLAVHPRAVSQAVPPETGRHPAAKSMDSVHDVASGSVHFASPGALPHERSSHQDSGGCAPGMPGAAHAHVDVPLVPAVARRSSNEHPMLPAHALLPLDMVEESSSEFTSTPQGSTAAVSPLGNSEHCMNGTRSRKPKEEQMRGLAVHPRAVSQAVPPETGRHPAAKSMDSVHDVASGSAHFASPAALPQEKATDSQLTRSSHQDSGGCGPGMPGAAVAHVDVPLVPAVARRSSEEHPMLPAHALLPLDLVEESSSEFTSTPQGSTAAVSPLGNSEHCMNGTRSRKPKEEQMRGLAVHPRAVSQAVPPETGRHPAAISMDSVHDVASGSVHFASPAALPQEKATDSQLTRSSHQDSGGCGPGMPGAAVAHVDVPLVPAVARRSSEEHPMLPAHALLPLDLVEESSSEFTSTPQGSTAAVSPLGNSEHCMNGTRSRKPKEEQMRGLAVHPRAVSQAVPPETGRHPAAKSMDSVHDVASGSVHFASPGALPHERSSHQDSGGCGPGMPGAAHAHVDVPRGTSDVAGSCASTT